MGKKRISSGTRKGCGILIILILAVLLGCSTAALGAWRAVGYALNLVTTGTFRTGIEEAYTPAENMMPGETVKKVVWVRNTGSSDAIIRVKVDKALGTLDETGSFVRNENLNTDCIDIHFDRTGLWRKLDDGYYYYCAILAPGEATRVPLMDSYTLTGKAGERERGKAGRIFISMESVQAKGNAVSLWNITKDQLGIEEDNETSEQSAVTLVTYHKDKKRFDFHPESTDLFACFKNLVPGEKRSQRILIENDSDSRTIILLKALPVHQADMPADRLALVNRILTDYGKITVRDKIGSLYQGTLDGGVGEKTGAGKDENGPDGPDQSRSSADRQGQNRNGMDGQGQSLAETVSLGVLEPHETREVTVTLSMSDEMDRKYQALLGRIGWKFSTGEGAYAEYPYTGDDTPVTVFAILLSASAGVVFMILILQKRRHRTISSGMPVRRASEKRFQGGGKGERKTKR